MVVTAVFENLARAAARAQGYPALPLLTLPHPMESRPDAEVRGLARQRLDELIGLLAKEV